MTVCTMWAYVDWRSLGFICPACSSLEKRHQKHRAPGSIHQPSSLMIARAGKEAHLGAPKRGGFRISWVGVILSLSIWKDISIRSAFLDNTITKSLSCLLCSDEPKSCLCRLPSSSQPPSLTSWLSQESQRLPNHTTFRSTPKMHKIFPKTYLNHPNSLGCSQMTPGVSALGTFFRFSPSNCTTLGKAHGSSHRPHAFAPRVYQGSST